MQIAYFQLKGNGKPINQDALFDSTNTHQTNLCHTKTFPRSPCLFVWRGHDDCLVVAVAF